MPATDSTTLSRKRRPGLHDAGRDASGEIVLKKRPALPHDMPMVLPAHEVGQARHEHQVRDDQLREMRRRADRQKQRRHQHQLSAGILPDHVRRRLRDETSATMRPIDTGISASTIATQNPVTNSAATGPGICRTKCQ